MQELQKSIIVGLGRPCDGICRRVVELIGSRELADKKRYPEFLHEVLSIKEELSVERDKERETPDQPNSERNGETVYVQLTGEFERIKAECAEALQQAISRVSDKSKLTALRRQRGFEVKREIFFYVVSPLCDEYSKENLLDLLEMLHTISGKHHYFLTHGVFLLPDLFSSLGKEYDPQLYKARGYAALKELDHIMNNRSASPWEGRYPLDKIWLVDGWSSAGEFIPIDEMESLIAEAITSMVVDGILEKGSGSGIDEREIPDKEGQYKLYSSFGFSQLLFSKDELRQQLLSQVKEEFLTKYLLQQRSMDRNSVIVDVRRFIHHDLEIEDLKEEIQHDREGKSIAVPFAPKTDKELPAKRFVQGVKREANLYEREQLAESIGNLISRAEEVQEEKLAITLNRAAKTINAKRVNAHMSGICYSGVFYDGLLDQDQENPLLEGPLFEEKKNLLTLRRDYEDLMENELGMESCREELKKVETRLGEKDQELSILEEEIASLQHKLEEYNPAAQEVGEEPTVQEKAHDKERAALEGELERLEEEKDGIKSEIERLGEEQQVLQHKIALINKIWEDDETRISIFRKVDEEGRLNIEQVEQELISTEDRLAETEQELEELSAGSRIRLRDLLLVYPAAALAGLLIDASIFLGAGWLSIPQFLEAMIKARWGGLAIALGYLVWAAWRYYTEILKQISLRKREAERLRGELNSLKTSLVDAYQTFFTKHIDIRTYEMAINKVLRGIIQGATAHREKIEAFLDHCETRAEELRSESFVYPESVARTSVISDKDSSFFFDLVVGDEIDKEFERLFTQTEEGGLAEFVEDSEGGFTKLGTEIAAIGQKYLDKLDEISIDEIIFDHWQDLHEKIPPEDRLASLLTVTPFVELQAPPGDDKIEEIYSIGVEDVDSSRLEGLIESARVRPQLFSHHDKTKIIAFCRTTNFSMRYLTQLEFYREA